MSKINELLKEITKSPKNRKYKLDNLSLDDFN